jgi:hypothetical protein
MDDGLDPTKVCVRMWVATVVVKKFRNDSVVFF